MNRNVVRDLPNQLGLWDLVDFQQWTELLSQTMGYLYTHEAVKTPSADQVYRQGFLYVRWQNPEYLEADLTRMHNSYLSRCDGPASVPAVEALFRKCLHEVDRYKAHFSSAVSEDALEETTQLRKETDDVLKEFAVVTRPAHKN